MKKIFIGVCLNGFFTPPEFITSLIELAASNPLQAMIAIHPGRGTVNIARNQLAADFLETDCTHLLFIDSDLEFSVADVVQITSHDEPVVGGLYPHRTDKYLNWCSQAFKGRETEPPDDRGLKHVQYMGTGFLCIAREVFDKMRKADGTLLEYQADGRDVPRIEWDFFAMGPRRIAGLHHRRYMTEDWWFCERWNQLGGKVFSDSRVMLGHIGPVKFPLKQQIEALMAEKP